MKALTRLVLGILFLILGTFTYSVANADKHICVPPSDVHAAFLSAFPGIKVELDSIFRYNQARGVARVLKLGNPDGWATFYLMVRPDNGRWMFYGANKNNCLLMFDGSQTTSVESFAAVTGTGQEDLARFLVWLNLEGGLNGKPKRAI